MPAHADGVQHLTPLQRSIHEVIGSLRAVRAELDTSTYRVLLDVLAAHLAREYGTFLDLDDLEKAS
jgi:hypothetical protein